MEAKPEVWLRGPLDGIPALLQPVAHALLQVDEEITVLMKDFPDQLLYEKPAGLANVAFHLQHLCGVLDRLFTYASDRALSPEQLQYLKAEGKPGADISSAELVHAFHLQVQTAVEQLKTFEPHLLTDTRMVGRKQIPSTVIGLLVHAAEHSTRHYGQLLVTVKVLTSRKW
jgi:uncharacterized damage-inducible protein DinB